MKLSKELLDDVQDFKAVVVRLPMEGLAVSLASDDLFIAYPDCNVLYANSFLDLTDIQNEGEASVHVVVFLPSSEECGEDRYYSYTDTGGNPV